MKVLFAFFCSFIFVVYGQETPEDFLWNRWGECSKRFYIQFQPVPEPRTIDCVSSGKKDDCVLLAPNSKIPFDITKFK